MSGLLSLCKNIVVQKLENTREGFLTYHYRPRLAEDFYLPASNESEVGIVIQGPIRYQDNFTMETVKLYRKIFPNCPIMVSTWDNEHKDVLQELESNGAIVIINQSLDTSVKQDGMTLNTINFQRTTSRAGIAECLHKGVKFCIKTRTDQRIYNPQALSYMKALVRYFSISEENISARGRILCTSYDTFKNRLYNISDLLVFGYTEDVFKYFSCPEDTRRLQGINAANEPKNRFGEIWFSTHYIEKLGHELKWTEEDYKEVLRNYFLIIDKESIDLLWIKYWKLEYPWRNYRDGQHLQELTFADWFQNYFTGIGMENDK